MRRALIVLGMLGAVTLGAQQQQQQQPTNDLPNPYKTVEGWAKLPAGRVWGSTSAVDIDKDGKSVWVAERCGANSCLNSALPSVLKFDENGTLVASFGAGMMVFPHGIHVDRDGNVWVTDGAISKDGAKGLTVTKLSPDGKVLLTIGTPGQRGDDATHFNSPSDVITAPNGDIFVTDGHAPIAPFIPPNLDMRVMKFDAKGKFIKQWGKPGAGPSEFNNPHALAFDGKGRLYVADRANNRIQIFTQDGKLITEWKQFGRPSGFYTTGDTLYAIDADSTEAIHPGWKKGVWIGSISQAKATSFVADDQAGEGVVVAPNGNMYGAVNVVPRGVTKYAKQK